MSAASHDGDRAPTRDFILPDLGEGLTEAELIAWKVGEGDEVHVDQLVVEVESAKSVVELPCPFAGKIATLHARPGDTVTAGQALLTVAEVESADAVSADRSVPADGSVSDGSSVSGGSDAPVEESQGRSANLIGYGTRERQSRPTKRRSFGSRTAGLTPVPDLPAEDGLAHAPAASAPTPATASAKAAPAGSDSSAVSPVVSPIVRRLAKEHGLAAKHLQGSGPGGVVTRADIAAAIEEKAAPEEAAPSVEAGADNVTRDTRTPITGLRKIVAERLTKSRQEIPEATIWLDVDATELLATKRALEARTGERYSLLSLVARFVVAGLKKHPILNSSIDTDAGEIVTHSDINLGLAAQTPRGLMVPVVHQAGEMSLRQLRDAISDTVGKSATGKFSTQELSGGTFTLNNYGVFGVDGSAPIINLPEVAMLGMGRIKDRPWVVDGQLTVRKVMYLSFVFDHRACDGAEPSEFLTFVADCIENPIALLPEV
ncbi:dihydrolipoamide acetyltransferase family protein [Brevibacterium sp.]|uniref:dihydrolipoamide acetyltransferase family protein n=1 Tax=Brevibacterium sp. TaxID=1701 RepID=UPI00281127E7|nr:dihydrolipoamide acetyltransferase family protein [Brevibacterium sp.]